MIAIDKVSVDSLAMASEWAMSQEDWDRITDWFGDDDYPDE